MRDWIEGLAGPAYASALMWTFLALVALLVVLVLVRIVRGFTFGTFVAGGRNRRARLAVIDATAVDSSRRLVLVRRDNVEHLLLIGGQTDIVVEQGIRPDHAAQAAPRTLPRQRESAPAAAQPPLRARPAEPQQQAASSAAAQAAAPAARPGPPQPVPRADPAVSGLPAAAVAATAAGAVAAPPPVQAAEPPPPSPPPADAGVLDDALMEELALTLDTPGGRQQAAAAQPEEESSLDEEMNRLLRELSGEGR